MGSNGYITAGTLFNKIKPLPEESDLIFNPMSEENCSGPFYRTVKEKGVHKYSSWDMCRETLLTEFYSAFYRHLSYDKESNGILGIMAAGFSHNQVAKYLLKESNEVGVKRLNRVLSRIFGFKFILTPETYQLGDDTLAFPVNLSVQTASGILMCPHYLKIILRNWENENIKIPPTHISALLAILREKEICQKIVDGEIKTGRQLALQLFKKSYDRYYRQDDSVEDYIGPFESLGEDIESYSLTDIKREVINFLEEPFNPEGIDFASVFFLGLYILEIKSIGYSDDYSGPVSFMQSRVDDLLPSTEKLLKSLKKEDFKNVIEKTDEYLWEMLYGENEIE